MTDEEVRAVGGGEVRDGRWHGRRVRDGQPGAVRPAYHAAMGVWVEIGDGVFVRRYAFYDQNIGVILSGDDVLVVDTRSTYGQAREILADLRELTGNPVTVVVDTHGHFDHAFGNRLFRPAPIWGHERCVTFMERTGEARKARIAADEPELADGLMEVVVDPPDRTFAETAYLDLTGRRIELRYLGRGHTDHDIVVGVPDAGVLFAGDLVENGAVPFFGDSYPLDWAETASRVAELSHGVVIPGHGDHGDRRFVEDHVGSFSVLANLARRVVAGEMTLDEAIAGHPFPNYPPADASRAFERTISQLRGELD